MAASFDGVLRETVDYLLTIVNIHHESFFREIFVILRRRVLLPAPRLFSCLTRKDGAAPIPETKGTTMAEPQIRFDDGAGYERMMGKWSRIAGEVFLDWLKPPAGLRWI